MERKENRMYTVRSEETNEVIAEFHTWWAAEEFSQKWERDHIGFAVIAYPDGEPIEDW